MAENTSKISIDKNILDLFWNLCDKNADTRINSCADLLRVMWKKQQAVESENELSKDLQYCIERLLKGLASPRDAARLGYTLLLTVILKKITVVQIEEVLELMKKHLPITSKQDRRDLIFGQLFAYSAIIRSGRLPSDTHLVDVILSLCDLYHGRNFILNAAYEVFLDIFSQLSSENFKSIWSQLKKKLPSDWESCSAESMWLLLLCIRMFPDVVSKKYMTKHWGNEDIFAPEISHNLKRIMKQTTSTLPNLHPMCTEILLHIKERKDFKEIWNSIVDDNLLDHEQNEKSFVGFKMIKVALQGSPSKKLLKTLLSPKFRTVFSRSFLNTKHPMNPAACDLADFLCNFVKTNSIPDMQIIVLKAFLQPPGTVLLDEILKKKEVSLLIQNLLPDAVKALCDILKAVLLKKKSNDNDDKEVNNRKRFQAVQQIGNLVAHPAILADMEWRLNVIQFLFLHSFFVVKEINSDIPHCDNIFEPLPEALRDACKIAFFKSVNSLHVRLENQHQSHSKVLEQLLSLIDYAEKLMSAPEVVEPKFSVETLQETWNHLKTIVHKLSNQSKKDGLVNESNAFQSLFLHLGLHLFEDPAYISDLLEELYICCKKSLKSRKSTGDVSEDKATEPPWIGVVTDIFLSLLSKSSHHFRSLAINVFPLFCPFIDSDALQQILDVINPKKADENMLVDESENEDEQDAEFGSGSSSEESDEERDNQPVDSEFKKKIQEALGAAADASDAESVVLSDSEMFKLDDALSEAFKSRLKSGHTQLASEDKALLNFRVRCLDLVLSYLRSEPPMHMVLMCIEPVLAAYEFGHHSKHQSPLLCKAVSVLQFITKIRKFQHHNDVSKSEFKRLLDVLIPKCHKEINISVSQKLSSLCVFIVLCCRKVGYTDSPDKKTSKIPFYVKTYLSTLETFVSSGSSHMVPNFFTHLMEACPDLAWHFIEPCTNHAFNSSTRLFKKTQCLGLLSESLKYSKSQKDISDDQWLELANNILPPVIESLKQALENAKPAYFNELLNIIYTLYSVVKEKTGQSVLEKHAELVSLLSGEVKINLSKKGKLLRNRIITCLGGTVSKPKKLKEADDDKSTTADQPNKRKRKSVEITEDFTNSANSDSPKTKKKKLKNKNKKKPAADEANDSLSDNNS